MDVGLLRLLRLALCLVAVACAIAPGHAAVVEMTQVGLDGESERLGYGNCQWLVPRDRAGERLARVPDYGSIAPVYYAARFGDAGDTTYTLVLDESGGAGTGYDTLYVDMNNDNRIDPEAERVATSLGGRGREGPRVRIHFDIRYGGVVRPYYMNFSAFPYSDKRHPVEKIHGNLRNSSYWQGRTVVDGTTRTIAVADLNSNGLFNDPEPRLFRGDRLFIDMNGDGKFRGENGATESFPYGDCVRVDGRWYRLESSPDGSRLSIAPTQPDLGEIVASNGIAEVTLRSSRQPLILSFDPSVGGKGGDGRAEGIAGVYRVDSVRLNESPFQGHKMTGSFRDVPTTLTIRKSESVRLLAGCPLRVSVELKSGEEERVIEINPVILGAGGEKYRWCRKSGTNVKAGFEIRDVSGTVVVSKTFEYG